MSDHESNKDYDEMEEDQEETMGPLLRMFIDRLAPLRHPRHTSSRSQSDETARNGGAIEAVDESKQGEQGEQAEQVEDHEETSESPDTTSTRLAKRKNAASDEASEAKKSKPQSDETIKEKESLDAFTRDYPGYFDAINGALDMVRDMLTNLAFPPLTVCLVNVESALEKGKTAYKLWNDFIPHAELLLKKKRIGAAEKDAMNEIFSFYEKNSPQVLPDITAMVSEMVEKEKRIVVANFQKQRHSILEINKPSSESVLVQTDTPAMVDVQTEIDPVQHVERSLTENQVAPPKQADFLQAIGTISEQMKETPTTSTATTSTATNINEDFVKLQMMNAQNIAALVALLSKQMEKEK